MAARAIPVEIRLVTTETQAENFQNVLEYGLISAIAIIPDKIASKLGCWTETGQTLDRILRTHSHRDFRLTTCVSGDVGGAIAGRHYYWVRKG